VEQARLKVRLSQAQLGRTLEITQGHYSKVMSGKAPLTDDLWQKMEAWLKTQEGPVIGPQVSRRMQELAASIRRECMELMHLVTLASDSDENGGQIS
jgi:hypothetical protein